MKYIKRFDEYLSQNISTVKTYFNKMSKADKEFIYNTYAYKYLNEYQFLDSLEYAALKDRIIKRFGQKKYDVFYKRILREINLFDTYGDEESLCKKYLFKPFVEYIINGNHDSMNFEDTYKNTSYSGIVKKQWIVHLTDVPEQIINKGFLGINDETSLALTYNKDDEKKYYGYNFGYTIDDFKTYGLKYVDYNGRVYRYGQNALIFMVSGVKVYHHGDEEYQTIFYGPDVKNINVIFNLNDGNYGILPKKNSGFKKEFIVVKGSIEECVDWFTTNYNQYKKYLN